MPLEKNVAEFINKAAAIVGQYESDCFSQNCSLDHDNLIKSPIERILYSAILAVAKVNGIESAVDPIQEDDVWHVPGLDVSPQYRIENYRADFCVSYERRLYDPSGWEKNKVLVECDSQQFHERTEPERRYEKRRDRHFASLGIHVFHYTGSEILKNPFDLAAEILGFINAGNSTKDELMDGLSNYLD